MADIYPFPGIRYNQDIVGDLAKVICPPYDVISPEEQKACYEKSEHNVIRLEHGMKFPQDNEKDNKNTRANIAFNKWLNERILRTDPVPSFYIHEHTFTFQNARKKRLGLIAAVRLEPWENRVVFPHENTAPGVKADRLELMRACPANFSPLLGLYEDPGQRATKLIVSRAQRKPLVEITADTDIHKVWMSNEPEFVQRVTHFFIPKPLYIADGHHRYETALAYRDERRQSQGGAKDNEAYNFVMMTLVSFSDSGLVALPIHRLVRGLSSEDLSHLRKELDTRFEVIPLPPAEAGPMEFSGATALVLGLEAGSVLALKMRPSLSLDELMPEGHSEAYRKLDVSIVQHLIIEKLPVSRDNGNIAYTPDGRQAQRLVENGDYQISFLLSPVPMATIKAISESGDRMPGKSTYFYPKLPTGLVMNRLAGTL